MNIKELSHPYTHTQDIPYTHWCYRRDNSSTLHLDLAQRILLQHVRDRSWTLSLGPWGLGYCTSTLDQRENILRGMTCASKCSPCLFNVSTSVSPHAGPKPLPRHNTLSSSSISLAFWSEKGRGGGQGGNEGHAGHRGLRPVSVLVRGRVLPARRKRCCTTPFCLPIFVRGVTWWRSSHCTARCLAAWRSAA